VAFQVALPAVCALVGGWRGVAQYAAFWLLPMLTVLQPILRLRAICEHGAVADFSSPLTAARSNRSGGGLVNALGRALLFPHHVNYHLEHHLYPAVPHYRLLGATLRLVFAPAKGTP
jgi:fatty acid desaturase